MIDDVSLGVNALNAFEFTDILNQREIGNFSFA